MSDAPETTDIVPEEPAQEALLIAYRYGQIEGDHHKAWVIDQMVRALLGGDPQAYLEWVAGYEEDGEFCWREGTPP